jgi:YfiH family protein
MTGAPELLEWDAPGPYKVAFSTRLGGVSEGPFASLNLGVLTRDEPERVLENRARLAAAIGADPRQATMAWQRHSSVVERARPLGIVSGESPFPPCDGLWTDEPALAMALVTADCVPVAICRRNGDPALCVLHVGWRGLLAGIVEEGCRALGEGAHAAAVGPGIGPCCYEVGEDVAAPYRVAFGDDVVHGGRLDLWTATERALLDAGCASVERSDRCTACDPDHFFSHRRDAGRTGRQGIIGYVVER